MKKVTLILSTLIISSTLIILLANSHNLRAQNETAVPYSVSAPENHLAFNGLYTGRRAEEGLISTSHLGVFGPGQCTAFGDPYSPISSVWVPGPYTYEYRILIPSDYQSNVSDVVRVELFDPETHNQAANDFTVFRSANAVNAGLSASASKTCTGGSSNRWNPCLLDTDEQSTGLDLDLINPSWFVRIDENRVPDCGPTNSYNPANNTETLYELYYYRDNGDGTTDRVSLSSYTGKADNTDSTDMRWVSPGTEVSFAFDYDPNPGGVDVPVDPGSPGDFEINLATEVPDIVTDPDDGIRYLYLDVTTVSGSSENGFDFWAGPENYISIVPSDVNDRNLYILNNPGAHRSGGIILYATNTLVLNSNFSQPLDFRLTDVGPEYAGETITVDLFDADSGAKPPLTFFWDSIDKNDWSLTFGEVGAPSEGRCFEGGSSYNSACNDAWASYDIPIPGLLDNCDWDNLTQADCTPFYGGRLMVTYQGGFSDTYAWEVSQPTDVVTPDPTVGCSAFPITVHEAVRSATPPGSGGPGEYPSGQFDYPNPEPDYNQFINHVPDIPLAQAEPGYLYLLQNGFGEGNFGWLVWNTGVSANASRLEESLTWPGNSTDYTPTTGGAGVPGSGLGPVNGYIEPIDPLDQAMHVEDWVAVSAGAINSNGVQAVLQGHIDSGRSLRLPVWDEIADAGVNGRYLISGFAIFRIVGYHLSASGQADSWLLLEFVDWDTSCGQIDDVAAPLSVVIQGPDAGFPYLSYNFTAVASPGNTALPITYTWKLNDTPIFTHTTNLSDTLNISWTITGSFTLSVTAVNADGETVADTHIIVIDDPWEVYLPAILNEE